jgi:hypothetical protein
MKSVELKSLDQHLEEINNMRKEIKLLEALLNELSEQCKQQTEFEYPIYMQSKRNKEVVKFTKLNTGKVVVLSDDCSASIGHVADNFVPHTDHSHWQPIIFDEERGIADKQLCECWDDAHTHARALRFYDAEHECAYSCQGNQSLISWDNYRPIPYADYPDWAIEAEKTLED